MKELTLFWKDYIRAYPKFIKAKLSYSTDTALLERPPKKRNLIILKFPLDTEYSKAIDIVVKA